jgi:type III pantothenate kinase
MNLTVDIGNTQIKLGVFEEDTLLKVYRFPTEILITDDFASKLKTVYKEFPSLKRGILCSVVKFENSMVDSFDFLNSLVQLTEMTPIDFTNQYGSASTLGPDRLAAISGSLVPFPLGNTLIINAGTCITYDFINYEKIYRGGAISPGIGLRSRALHTFTSKLPLIELKNINETPFMGENTVQCIQSGILWGVFHEVNGFIGQYSDLQADLKIILAGGDANFLDTHLKNTIFAHQIKWMPDLVLIGLNRILKIQDA